MPLALAFGISSGLGAQAGLVTAVTAGAVAAIFGGSHLQVSGPTGAMTVVLVPLVSRHGADAVVTVGVVAGAILLAAAVLRLGRYVAFIPWPVVEGFTVGIAVIIFLQQIPAALGVQRPKGDNTAVVAVRAVAHAGRMSTSTLLLVAIVAVVMKVGPRLRQTLPVSLLGVGLATLVSELGDLHVPRIGELPSSFPAFRLPELGLGRVSELFGAAIAVAALAALESLLSAKVADGMADNRTHDPDRELVGQGLANVVSPLFGGMPATGAIARTAVNIRAGARSRLAALTHAGVLVLVACFGSSVIARVPLAALAGVLLVTALRMVELHNVRRVIRATNGDALVLGVTATATVVFDLIVAVEVGIAVAALLALREVAAATVVIREPVAAEIGESDEHRLLHDHIVTYRIDGALFFGAAQRFLTELVGVGDVRVVILRLPGVSVLDASGAKALGDIVDQLERRQITVLLKVPSPAHRRVLAAVGATDGSHREDHVFAELAAAIEHARVHVARQDH